MKLIALMVLLGSVHDLPPMTDARAAHTATTLADGSVLVFGGFAGDEQQLSGADLYDPKRGRFVRIENAPLRQSHTASVLPNGRVLMAGGYNGRTGCVDSTVLFDPETHTFSSGPRMSTSRCEHAAITLSDGRIALVGGKNTHWTILDSVEVFDPRTGSFALAGRMTMPRTSNVSVLLPDGRIFIAGGSTGRRTTLTIHASSEIFDPRSGSSTPSAPMATARHKHDAVALADGRVLVNGGSNAAGALLDSAEIYDPARDEFVPAARMNRARYKHRGSSLLLANGKVLIGGGAQTPELYDPITDTFSLLDSSTPLPGRFSAVAVLDDRRVLISGGYHRPDAPSHGAWIYDGTR